MKAIYISSLILIFLLNCSSTQERKTFEGEITYKISIASKTTNNQYYEYQKQKYGDSVLVSYCANGSFRRDYFASGISGFDFFLYDSKSNLNYTKWRNIDTIYAFDSKVNSIEYVSDKELPGLTILNEKCSGYFISGKDPKGGQVVSLSYYYPEQKEYIDSNLYVNFKDFFFDKVMAKMQAPFYKLIMDMTYYEVTFEAVKIESKIVSKSVIELPSNIPIRRK